MKECILKIEGREERVPAGTSFFEMMRSKEVSGNVIAVCVNGQPKDLKTPIQEDVSIEAITFDSSEGKEIYRHTSTHLMAQAVKELFPSAKMTIGPATEDGFYYDFDFERSFLPEDLQKIEERMREIIKRDLPITRKELSQQEAIEFFRTRGESYKVELIQGIDAPSLSVYTQGDFADLCRGPHLASTGVIGDVRLLKTSGAYWRGDEKNPRLQRIYGTSFPTREQMEKYLAYLEEVKKRDHRKLGQALDLFSISDEIGPGLVLWHPKGGILRKTIEDFWREAHLSRGYEMVYTPHMAQLGLWKQSGHLDFYKENMFAPMEVDGASYEIKPMNCPFHIMIYKSRLRSYRDLPMRWAELGSVYRYERSGVLHGLMRVRGFTQDDAHLFCRPDQIESEIVKVLDLVTFVFGTFGFSEYDIYLSTRPEKYVGSLDRWEIAEEALKKALEQKNLPYRIDPGEGVFYGPKIDIKIKDALGRSWQCSTVQIDFNLPERFDIRYWGEDGRDHQPIMIHRALFGSLERFFGILIEHYGGAFPTWLAPVQVHILPVTKDQEEYSVAVQREIEHAGFRCTLDARRDTLGSRIRDGQLMKIPYMLILGKREAIGQTLSVRHRSGENTVMTCSDFIEYIKKEVLYQREVCREVCKRSETSN